MPWFCRITTDYMKVSCSCQKPCISSIAGVTVNVCLGKVGRSYEKLEKVYPKYIWDSLIFILQFIVYDSNLTLIIQKLQNKYKIMENWIITIFHNIFILKKYTTENYIWLPNNAENWIIRPLMNKIQIVIFHGTNNFIIIFKNLKNWIWT